jgi:GDPmannose 4,6-dehydratase
VDSLLGDASKAEKQLGWKPRTSFEQLVTLMMESDLELARRERLLAGNFSPIAGTAQ